MTTPERRPSAALVSALVLLACGLHALLLSGRFVASPGWWAFDYLRRLSVPLFWGSLAVATAAAGVWWWRLDGPADADSPPERSRTGWRGALLFGLLFTLFFVLLRERVLWGDARSTIRILEGRARVGPLGIYFWKEPADRLLAMLFHEIAARWFGRGAGWGIALMNSLAGAGAVLAILRVARALRLDRGGELFAACSLLTMGASQLFFGHVENYTLVYLGILVFCWLALESLHGRVALWAPLAVAAVSLTTHGLAVFLLPAVVYLWLRAPAATGARWLAPLPGTLYLVVFYLFARWLGAGPLPIGVNSFADNETLLLSPAVALSAAHLSGVAQGMLRTGSLGTWLLVVFVLRPGAWTRLDVAGRLLWVNAVSFVAFAVFLNGTLERSRDWDLFAAGALPLVLALSSSALREMGGAGSPTFRLATTLALALSGSAVVPWILSNRFPLE